MNISDNSYKPYVKPNNTTKYVNIQSNHPPIILNNIPDGVNHRLNIISSSKEQFDNHTKIYQEELNRCGYKHKLQYNPIQSTNKTSKNRSRKILWYNPPYNQAVSTNIGKEFFRILESCFPNHSKLYKLFNKNSCKLSYSTMPNFGMYIKAHNRKIFRENSINSDYDPPPGALNCTCPNSKKLECPLRGRCKDRNLIYMAEVTDEDNHTVESYVGSTSTTFKEKFGVNKQSFKNRNTNKTVLSRYIWSLKDKGHNFHIKYRIVAKARPYDPKFKQCGLCIKEATVIITQPQLATLNKRNELTSKCLHREKYLLKNVPD